jgi:transposase-like protein
MEPTTAFCPNGNCPARGQIGRGNIGIHSRKDQRCICHACHKTFSATTGTVFYRLRTAVATVGIVVTVLAYACPLPAIVAAWGFDERTVAAWWARSGRQGQAVPEDLGEAPRDLGQMHAEELRVQTQGGIVWRALAMRVTTRVGLGGAVSAQRDLPLIRRLLERVKRGAARRPLWGCTDGLVSSIRAMQETCRAPVHTGKGDGRGSVPGAMAASPQSSSAPRGGGWSRPNAVWWRARRHAWRRSDTARKGTGGFIRPTLRSCTRRSGNASHRWRVGAGRWPAPS